MERERLSEGASSGNVHLGMYSVMSRAVSPWSIISTDRPADHALADGRD